MFDYNWARMKEAIFSADIALHFEVTRPAAPLIMQNFRF